MRVRLLLLFLCVSVMGSTVVSAYADNDPCQHWATGVPGNPFPWGFGPWNCYFIGYPGWTCSVYACPPPEAVPCKDCSASNPIDLLTGDTWIEETDVKIPGLSRGLTLTRTWNSIFPSGAPNRIGMFGRNWTSTYEERMFRQPSTNYQTYYWYARADGTLWAWSTQWGYVLAPENAHASLGLDINQNYLITFHDGEQRVFSFSSGSLIAIIDRNGNTTSLSYDATNRLTTVTDPAGRHLYFNYPNNSSYLVSSVTSDVGLTATYTYDAQSRLTQVTENDGSFVTFTYDANSNITTVKDSLGNLIESHTYDSENRGLTGSRGSAGAEAVTVSYPNP